MHKIMGEFFDLPVLIDFKVVMHIMNNILGTFSWLHLGFLNPNFSQFIYENNYLHYLGIVTNVIKLLIIVFSFQSFTLTLTQL